MMSYNFSPSSIFQKVQESFDYIFYMIIVYFINVIIAASIHISLVLRYRKFLRLSEISDSSINFSELIILLHGC